jgi:hypothetical protein
VDGCASTIGWIPHRFTSVPIGDARFDGATRPENAWFDEAIFAGAERVRWAGANSYVVDELARMKACQRYSTRQNS